MKNLVKILGVISGLVFGTPSYASTIWDNPNSSPYSGSLDNALSAFNHNGIDEKLLLILKNKLDNHQCYQRLLINGENIDLMMSGTNTVLKDVTVRTDEWKPNQDQVVLECPYISINSNGIPIIYTLLYPYVCGNWSYKITTVAAKPGYTLPYPLPYTYPYGGGGGGLWNGNNGYNTLKGYHPVTVDEPNTILLLLPLLGIILIRKYTN
jgi:hypothetical protein